MDENILFFSAEAKAPAGKLLMDLIGPIETEFNKKFSSKYSGGKLKCVTIVFICMDEDMLHKGFYEERRFISWKKQYADIRLMIPYTPFLKGSLNEKKQLVWEVIKQALEYLYSKNAFSNIDEFAKDISNVFWNM